MNMKCHKCGRGLFDDDGIALHRQNPKGELPAVWACDDCNTLPIDPLVKEITDVIQEDNRRERKTS